MNFNIIRKITAEARIDIIRMINAAGSGHPGGSLSIIDALTTLYFTDLLNYDAADPKWKDRDRVILSKGHCAPALYTMLAYAGFFPKEDLMTLRKFGSHLQGHTDLTKTPGVESCGGPLGQGLSVGLGIAIAAKINKQNFKTYVLLGDGETAKGNVTEAAKMAGVLKVNNLIAFIDYNKIDQDGRTKDVLPLNFRQEWESYNWDVIEIKGYEHEEIYNATKKAQQNDKPTVIILDTIKAKGISFMEDLMYAGNSKWHGQAPKNEDFTNAINELTQKLNALNESTDTTTYIESIKLTPERKQQLTTLHKDKVQEITSLPTYEVGTKVATRNAFGDMLPELGKADERIVILTAGVGGSVKFQKFIALFGTFSKENPQGRFIQCAIAEANMAGVAAGLALAGKKPWMATFDIFMKEMLGVIRNAICYAKLDVKIVGTHAGAGVEDDGGSHQSLLEPGIMADLPNMISLEPVDGNETIELMEKLWKENKAAYFRLTRQNLLVLQRNYALLPGQGIQLIHDNENPDITKQVYLVGSAGTVEICLEAAKILEEKGLKCSVLNAMSMSYINTPQIQHMVQPNSIVVTVHDALKTLLAEKVALALSTGKHNCKVIGLGLKTFGESGKIAEIYKKHGFDVEGIVKTVIENLL